MHAGLVHSWFGLPFAGVTILFRMQARLRGTSGNDARFIRASTVFWFLLVLANGQRQHQQPDALSKALLDDLIPPSSAFCTTGANKGTTTISFDYSPDPRNEWDVAAQPLEENLFLFQMGHDDPDTNRTWQLRVGRGSNLYSFIGAYGESVPPQFHANGEFVDDVWQNVVVADSQNRPDAPYFIHQAGTYAKGNRSTPFYSPNVGHYCDQSHCSTASWGQHAHLPTRYKSSALYLNRYTDCGDGVVELTSVIHNMVADHAVPFTYTDVPWGGVRTSTLSDMLVANVSSGARHMTDLWGWGVDTWLPSLSDTGGYTAFAQSLPRDRGPFVLPSGLSLQSLGTCQESGGHSKDFGIYTVWCPIQPTVTVGYGVNTELTLTNPSTGGSIPIVGVHHWSWEGNKVYLYPLVSADEMNIVFPAGANVEVSYRDISLPVEDNLALSIVHGAHAKASWDRWDPRLRMGDSGSKTRDYTVFAINTIADIGPGQTYVQRQFMITDQFLQIDARSRRWSDETMRNRLDLPDTAPRSREVRLYLSTSSSSSGTSSFTVQVEPDQCSFQIPVCVGATAPGPNNAVAYFAISCGDTDHYVGADLYHFSPPSPPNVQSWSCGNSTDRDGGTTEPSWKLLGYFQEGSCPLALATAKFEG
jgi:hypothetical protein